MTFLTIVHNPSKKQILEARNHIEAQRSPQGIPKDNTIMSWHIVMQRTGWNDVIWVLWLENPKIRKLVPSSKIWAKCAQSFEKTDFGSQEPYWSPEIAPEHFKQQYYHVLTHCDAKTRLEWLYLSSIVQNVFFRRIVHIGTIWCRSPRCNEHPDFWVFELPNATETTLIGFLHHSRPKHVSTVNWNAPGRSLAPYVGSGIRNSFFRRIVHIWRICWDFVHWGEISGARPEKQSFSELRRTCGTIRSICPSGNTVEGW